MISLDSNTSTTNPSSTNQTNNIIIFEYNDFRRDTGLILLKRNKKSNDDENKFELHLYNDYTNQAIAMILR
jgi:hypothetical protein